MSLLPELESGWAVDQAIVTEEERVVVVRFGQDDDLDCIAMDDILYKVEDVVRNIAVIYVVDVVNKVTDFNQMFDLVDPLTIMFFYRNNHIQVDFGTGDNNKLTWPIGKEEFIVLLQDIYKGASQGRGIITSSVDYSHAHRG